MDRFSKLHPIMQMLFFIFSLVLVISANNPIISAVSLICAFLYSIKLRGKNAFTSLKLVVFLLATVSVFNMIFAHYGQTIMFTIKSVDYSLEPLFYGFNQGMVLSSVIIWFDALSRVIDSERVIYLFRFSPKIALIFSMVLGFIPRFTKKLRDINDAKKGLGILDEKGLVNRVKSAINTMSALITYSLESSIITADSMQARGYNPKAIRHSRFKYRASDLALTIFIVLSSAFVIYEFIAQKMAFVIDDTIYIKAFSVPCFVLFLVLELLPLIVDLLEDLLWKLSTVKA